MIQFYVEGMQQLIDDAEAAGFDATPLTNKYLKRVASQIRRLARLKAPHATGDLQRSILVGTADLISSVTVDSPYGEFVEYGTKAHNLPPGALDSWAKKKGMSDQQKNAIIFGVIAKKGTKAHPFFYPAVEESIPYADIQLQILGDAIVDRAAGA